MIKVLDFIFSMLGALILFPLALLIFVVCLFDTGSPIFKQVRVGKNKKPFILYKFRTMNVQTKSVATHLINHNSITKVGVFLRKTKLDELPQLVNVLKGEMSFVGPRPCLYNQIELIFEREERGVYKYLPGITGLAQINEIDMSNPLRLAKVDAEMMQNLSISKYFRFILETARGKGGGDRVLK